MSAVDVSVLARDRQEGDRDALLLSKPVRSLHGRGWLVRRVLVAADALGLSLAYLVAEVTVPVGGHGDHVTRPTEFALLALMLPAFVVVAKLYGLYDRDEDRTDHSTVDEFSGVFHLVTVAAWLLLIGGWLTGLAAPVLPKMVVFWITAVAAITVARGIARFICRRTDVYPQNAIIVGAGEIGQLIARKLVQHPEYRINLVGFVDAMPRERWPGLEHVALLGHPADLPELVDTLDVERVIVAFSNDRPEDILGLIRELRDLRVQIDVVPRLFEVLGPKTSVHSVEGLPVIGLPAVRLSRSSRLIKRLIDVVVASVILILVSPLAAAIALAVRLDSRGPILFKQKRLGIDQREFTILKFRTMHQNTDPEEHRSYIAQSMNVKASLHENGFFKPSFSSITRVGRFLRLTSLDELPQLINVLRGDMSLVGPRPCLRYETELFEPHHFERFLVPAGLTGLWQVTARAKSTFVEALDMDVAYARGWSIGLDLRLLCLTPLQLIRLRGSS